MIVSSPIPVYIYTDHQVLRTLLTRPANDSHGKIASWQQRLSEYDMVLLHRKASTHFMGIADGMSRLPSTLMGKAFVENAMGPDAELDWGAANGRVRIHNADEVYTEKGILVGNEVQGDKSGRLGSRMERVAAVRCEGNHSAGGNGQDTGAGERDWVLEEGAEVLKWEKWNKLLDAPFFRNVLLFKLGGVYALARLGEDVGRDETRGIEGGRKVCFSGWRRLRREHGAVVFLGERWQFGSLCG